jgi:hypothetical protein
MYEPAFHDSVFRDLWNLSSTQSFDRAYKCLVHSYAKRLVTRESDGLAAFTGILKVMSRVTGLDFLLGLPKSSLDVALTWILPSCQPSYPSRSIRCESTHTSK